MPPAAPIFECSIIIYRESNEASNMPFGYVVLDICSYSLFFLTWPLSYHKTDDNNIEQGQNPGARLRKTDCRYRYVSTKGRLIMHLYDAFFKTFPGTYSRQLEPLRPEDCLR